MKNLVLVLGLLVSSFAFGQVSEDRMREEISFYIEKVDDFVSGDSFTYDGLTENLIYDLTFISKYNGEFNSTQINFYKKHVTDFIAEQNYYSEYFFGKADEIESIFGNTPEEEVEIKQYRDAGLYRANLAITLSLVVDQLDIFLTK